MRVFFVVISALLCLAGSVQAQLVPTGAAYRVGSGTGDGAGVSGITFLPFSDPDTNEPVNAVFGGGPDAIGMTGVGAPATIFADDSFTDLGGGDFELTIRVFSDGELSPGLVAAPERDVSLLFVGQNFQNGPNLPLADHVVSSATLSAFTGSTLLQSRNLLAGTFPAFTDPDDPANVEWQGFLGLGVLGVIGTPAQPVNELRFTLTGSSDSLTAVPEPGTTVLLGSIALVSMLRRRRLHTS